MRSPHRLARGLRTGVCRPAGASGGDPGPSEPNMDLRADVGGDPNGSHDDRSSGPATSHEDPAARTDGHRPTVGSPRVEGSCRRVQRRRARRRWLAARPDAWQRTGRAREAHGKGTGSALEAHAKRTGSARDPPSTAGPCRSRPQSRSGPGLADAWHLVDPEVLAPGRWRDEPHRRPGQRSAAGHPNVATRQPGRRSAGAGHRHRGWLHLHGTERAGLRVIQLRARQQVTRGTARHHP